MLISLDYDDTYTRDPEMWNAFIALAHSVGHEVIVVTMRHPTELAIVNQQLEDKVKAIYPTSGRQKRKFMRDVHKLLPHVWIDDMPEFIADQAMIFDFPGLKTSYD